MTTMHIMTPRPMKLVTPLLRNILIFVGESLVSPENKLQMNGTITLPKQVDERTLSKSLHITVKMDQT